ncbi:hypothetical protein [Oleisolibacter albus]|uniref:hypothetical protein n=1 Tax=Oleisolibacter albus TaxID=2171757 RepID=UPI000DF32F80|nr:hypothetical protein [Oleisolibacter albus]
MLSLPKLLLLALVLYIVWTVWRTVQRRDARRREMAASAGRSATSDRSGRTAVAAEEMVKCPGCGVYVAADARKCGTPGCPRR